MRLQYFLFVALFVMGAAACGVRGRPLPPELPPQLGRGEPSFKKATEGIQVPSRNKKSTQKSNTQDNNDSKSGDYQ